MLRVLFILLGAAWTLFMVGCASPPVRPSLPVANIPAEVGVEIQRSVAGWNQGDLAMFLNMYAETATFALADEFLTGRPAIWNFYAPNFAPGTTRDALAFDRLEIEVLSPDTALARGIYRNSRIARVTRRGTTTLVFRRIAGQWRVIHDHTN